MNDSIEPIELHKIFKNSIDHILSVKPFFYKLKCFPLRKMELAFFQKDLGKHSIDINLLLDGCLDCLKKISKKRLVVLIYKNKSLLLLDSQLFI